MEPTTQSAEDLDTDRILFDYERTQEMIIHLETLFWQVGAIFLAGLLIGIAGFVQGSSSPDSLDRFPVIIAVTLCVVLFWFLWYQRERVLVTLRLHRLYEIERKIPELRQFTYSSDGTRRYYVVSFWKSPRLWILARTRHSTLIRWFCILFPLFLILEYVRMYLQWRGPDLVLLGYLFVFAVPLFFVLFYRGAPFPEQSKVTECEVSS